MRWLMVNHADPEILGYLPNLLSASDPRPAREQLAVNYAQGGGWRPLRGFELDEHGQLIYPGDPPIKVLAVSMLRHEEIRLYEHEWLMILQPDGTFEVSRVN